ncbi:MAG: PKD domain-containing protein, partial [Cyclobacteriaceae bacterium]|nr:PKD domain-containing protein [Cyclobacteriaceae bacterium]
EGWGIVFAGRGDGIYKSVNNGPFLKTTGTVTNDNNAIAEFHEIPKLLITGDHALLASVNGDVHVGLFRSADGGNTWTKVLTGEAGDLEISADKKVIYAGTGRGFNAGKIYKSLDQGLTWTEFTNVPPNGERIEIATSPSDPNRVYLTATSGLDVGWMVSSKDQGASWTGINIPPHISISSCEPAQNDFTRSQGWYDLIMAVHPTNPDIIFAGGVDMHRSLDGGVTWQAVSNWADNCQRYMHADQHAINFRPGHPDQAIFGNDGGVYFSSNLLDSLPYFHMRNKGYNVTQFYSVATDNNAGSNYFLGGTQDNGTRKFVHEGINETTMAFGGDGGFCFIDYNEPKIQIASYIYNSYALSLDSGKTFKDISNDYTHGKFINPSEYDHQQNMLYAGGKADQYFRYTNLTNTVIADSISIGLNGGAVSFLKSSPFTSNRLFIGTDNGQLFIADNTHTTPVPQHISDNGFQGTLNCIETGANDDQLLAVFSNYGVVSVWETLDGGMTWQDKEGNLPDMPIYWALYNPNNRKQVLLATELGMWSTNDITLTSPIWEPTNTDLAHVRCSMIRYRPADGLVAVATYGRGIYTSDIFMGTPTARFEVSNKVAYTGQSIQFTDYSEGAANMYLWDFGDGSTSAIRNPLHAYTSPGTYKTTLSINNGKDIMSDLITVLPDKPVSYKADYGGNFEINPEDFGTETRSGTGFERGVSTVNGKEGTTSGTHAFVTGLTTDYYVENTETYLYTPNFDFTNAGNYSFSFSANHHIRDSIDGFIVEYSLNKSGIWREVIDLSSTNWHNDIHSTATGAFTPGSGIFSGNSNGYTQYSADVSFLSGNTDVAFRFLFRSVSGGITGPFSGLAIDDIEILAPIYADFTVDTTQTCTENTLTFTDQSGGSATGLIS